MVREIEVLAAARATVMATRRQEGPPGRKGGKAGAPGRDRVLVGGKWRPLPPGGSVALGAGDRVRVETPGGGGFGRALR